MKKLALAQDRSASGVVSSEAQSRGEYVYLKGDSFEGRDPQRHFHRKCHVFDQPLRKTVRDCVAHSPHISSSAIFSARPSPSPFFWFELSTDLSIISYSLSFHGRLLIENAEISLNYGQRYGLLGENGSGKSTFLQSIAERDIDGIPEHIDVSMELSALEDMVGSPQLDRSRERSQHPVHLAMSSCRRHHTHPTPTTSSPIHRST